MSLNLPAIPVANPTVVAAVTIPEIVFDNFWLSALVIQNFDMNANVLSASFELTPYSVNVDGSLNSNPSGTQVIKIPNLYVLAESNPLFAQALEGVLGCVIAYAQGLGLVASPPTFTSASSTIFTTENLNNSFIVSTIGQPVATLTAVNFPTGVTFTDNGDGTGILSGTTSVGSYSFTLTATNAVSAISQNFLLTVEL